LTIGGRFEGNVHAADELVVLATGCCKGRVQCLNLVVHEGGRLDAEVSQINRQDAYRKKKLSAPAKPVIDL
jgi:cytoskeletal protein CcmA (bactofilin family)